MHICLSMVAQDEKCLREDTNEQDRHALKKAFLLLQLCRGEVAEMETATYISIALQMGPH